MQDDPILIPSATQVSPHLSSHMDDLADPLSRHVGQRGSYAYPPNLTDALVGSLLVSVRHLPPTNHSCSLAFGLRDGGALPGVSNTLDERMGLLVLTDPSPMILVLTKWGIFDAQEFSSIWTPLPFLCC